ncbi:MAG: WYL domain-containing protein, partial [Gemmatimonadaceae bacterium]
ITSVLPAHRALDDASLDRRVRLEFQTRTPHALLINWPAWYLLGHDYLRGAARTFRFDRFESVFVEETQAFRARPREIASAVLSDTCGVLAEHM